MVSKEHHYDSRDGDDGDDDDVRSGLSIFWNLRAAHAHSLSEFESVPPQRLDDGDDGGHDALDAHASSLHTLATMVVERHARISCEGR